MSLFRSILCVFSLSFTFAASAADETAWYLQNTVSERGPGMAGLCSGGFNLVIKQPLEEEDCDGFFDVLFYADLKTRKIYWSKAAAKSVSTREYRESSTAVLRNQLQSGGKQTLEDMRAFYLSSNGESQNQSDSYFADFRCPESLPDEQARIKENERFIEWLKSSRPDITPRIFVEERMRFLKEHRCKITAENIRINSLGGSKASNVDSLPAKSINEGKPKAVAKVEVNPDALIEFKTAYAEQKVRGYRFNCPQPGKSASLMDALRLGVLEASYMGGGVRKLYATVDSRGDEIRVYHQIRGTDGFVGPSNVVMTLDKWGELKLNGITKEALYNNLCFR